MNRRGIGDPRLVLDSRLLGGQIDGGAGDTRHRA